MLVVHVGDMIVAVSGSDCERLWAFFLKMFPVDNLGSLTGYTECAFERDACCKTVEIMQTAYVERIAECFGITRTRFNPASASVKLGTKPEGEDNPTEEHWKAALPVLQYPKRTSTYAVTFLANSERDLHVYADANFARDSDDRRSILGDAVVYEGAALSWFSRVQICVATSSTEAEYVALSDVVKESDFVERSLTFLEPQHTKYIVVHENNQGAIRLATNPPSSGISRHIDVRYHHVRYLVKARTVEVGYVATYEQHADILTKPVEETIFRVHRNLF